MTYLEIEFISWCFFGLSTLAFWSCAALVAGDMIFNRREAKQND